MYEKSLLKDKHLLSENHADLNIFYSWAKCLTEYVIKYSEAGDFCQIILYWQDPWNLNIVEVFYYWVEIKEIRENAIVLTL